MPMTSCLCGASDCKRCFPFEHHAAELERDERDYNPEWDLMALEAKAAALDEAEMKGVVGNG